MSCIICPECKNLARIKFYNDIILVQKCIKKHKFQFLDINEFIYTQFINEESIKCDICDNNKSFYDIFYICSCGKYICSLCYTYHDEKHKKIKYNDIFYFCYKHSLEYISYCNT